MEAKKEFISPEPRIIHFLIDSIIIYSISSILNEYVIMGSMPLLFSLIYLSYYLILEMTLQKTLGKFISNTVVLTAKGEKPELNQIVFRSLSRFIPFEVFSCFHNYLGGWHDRISKTCVINEKKLTSIFPDGYTFKCLSKSQIITVRLVTITLFVLSVFYIYYFQIRLIYNNVM